jgi:hypothetical protein
MHFTDRRSAVLLLVLLTLAGCRAERVTLIKCPQSGRPEATGYDDSAWATVVRENVKEGLVDYEHLADHRDALNEFLVLIAKVGPLSTPAEFSTPGKQLAYYINAYNAAVLAAVLQSGIPDTMHPENENLPFDRRFSLLIDGQVRTLYELRQMALNVANGDVRVVLALCHAAKGAPRLHDQPFRPQTLNNTLTLLIRKSFDQPHLFAIDHLTQTITLGDVFHQYRQLFVNDYQRRTHAAQGTLYNALLLFCDSRQRQRLNSAVGYTISTNSFDQSLNNWRPAQKTTRPPSSQ